MDIQEKAAIVTGAGTGVGRDTALRLARGGCAVLVNYNRSKDQAEAVAEQCRQIGVQAIACQADVADNEHVQAMVKTAVENFGRLDILVNNAGTTRFIPHTDLDAVTDDDWLHIMSVNVLGAFHCARAVQQPMLESGGGEIINVSSIAGINGRGSSIPYSASKAALINMTVTLARVMCPKIRVNCIAPGFIAGSWTQKGLGDSYEATKKKFEHTLPLGKVCTPDDVAQAIVGLVASSDMITGHTLVCDGGMIIAKAGV